MPIDKNGFINYCLFNGLSQIRPQWREEMKIPEWASQYRFLINLEDGRSAPKLMSEIPEDLLNDGLHLILNLPLTEVSVQCTWDDDKVVTIATYQDPTTFEVRSSHSSFCKF
jgi:hypothetical protein